MRNKEIGTVGTVTQSDDETINCHISQDFMDHSIYSSGGIVTLVSAKLIDGRLEITKRYSPEAYCHPAPPDRLEKEIYEAVGNGIVLVETIQGKITPGYFIEEKIEFEEE